MTTPRSSRRYLVALLATVVALVGAGCGSDDANGARAEGAGAAGETSAWLDLPLTDVAGETFTIADLAGTPVFVENFATWCSNCRKQLGDTQEAAADAGNDAVFLALSVETELDPSDVAAYAEQQGFSDIRFAVMTPEFLAAMSDAFGNSALNPPSTPKVLVNAAGEPGELVTGFESPDEIRARLDSSA